MRFLSRRGVSYRSVKWLENHYAVEFIVRNPETTGGAESVLARAGLCHSARHSSPRYRKELTFKLLPSSLHDFMTSRCGVDAAVTYCVVFHSADGICPGKIKEASKSKASTQLAGVCTLWIFSQRREFLVLLSSTNSTRLPQPNSAIDSNQDLINIGLRWFFSSRSMRQKDAALGRRVRRTPNTSVVRSEEMWLRSETRRKFARRQCAPFHFAVHLFIHEMRFGLPPARVMPGLLEAFNAFRLLRSATHRERLGDIRFLCLFD